MKRDQIAKENFLKGYNCTQAVVLAFSDVLGIDGQTALRLVSPFGGGMGRLREVCGTVSAMFFVLGAARGYADPKDTEGKKRLYAEVQELAEAFRKENGSIICRELLGVAGTESPVPETRTAEYYKKRPCPELCAAAARILAEKLSIPDGNKANPI